MGKGNNKSPRVPKHGIWLETEAQKRAMRERLARAGYASITATRLPDGPNAERLSAQPRDEDELMAAGGRAPTVFEEA